MSVYLGQVMSVEELLSVSLDDNEIFVPSVPSPSSAAANIENCGVLLTEGADLLSCWRFGILQTIDDYQSSLRVGLPAAVQIFTDEPIRVDACLDAAIAGLVEYLANRDGWTPVSWSSDPSRTAPYDWFVAGIEDQWLKSVAREESPPEFSSRRVFTSLSGLVRV